MQASELRIGNTVEYNIIGENDDRWILNDVDKDDICDTSYLRPMKITNEDWQNIGCVKDILCDVSGFVIFKNSYAYQFLYADYGNWHELQNLYFALTQEELIIK
jgi:hypothetical protein